MRVTTHVDAGMGDKLDRKASQTLEPGGYVMLPANMHHFAWTSVPTVVQINLEGPFDLFYVNPADNPQWGRGGGSETITPDSVPVDPNTIVKLKGSP